MKRVNKDIVDANTLVYSFNVSIDLSSAKKSTLIGIVEREVEEAADLLREAVLRDLKKEGFIKDA